MTRLIQAELLKIRTARSSLVMCLIAFGLPMLVALLACIFGDFSPVAGETTQPPGQDMIDLGQFCFFLTLILGTLVIAGEFRHGSIAPSLLVTPSRSRLYASKLIAIVITSILISVIAVGGCVLIGGIILPLRDFEFGIGAGDVIEGLAVTAGVASLYGLLGLGTGALLRNQAGAIVVVLMWLFVVESIVGGLWVDYQPYAISNVLTSAAGATEDAGLTDPVSQAEGFGLGALYAAALAAAGWLMLERSDVTG